MSLKATNQPQKGVPLKQSEITKSRASIMIASLLVNVFGAGLTFVYFTFVRSGIAPDQAGADIKAQTTYFLFMMILLCLAVAIPKLRYYRFLRKDLARIVKEPESHRLKALVRGLLNLPLSSAAFSFLAWIAAAVMFGPIREIWMGEEWRTWDTFEIFFGIIFVGAPFALLFEYFILEWIVTSKIQGLFPADVLTTTPDSVRINVLPKLIVVSLMIGVVPVTTVSYITLEQIHRIESGSQDIGSFVGQMPVVIAFLGSWAVLVAVGLSVFVARSVSKPLRHMTAAMQRIRQGDLEVKIPVVSNDEIGAVTAVFNRGVAGLRELNFIRDTFGSYLGPEVVSEILKSPTGVNLGGELREVTILVSDLRGFTPLTASSSPEMVVEILNRFLEKMVEVIIRHDGTIDEFTGDGILAFFGAPRRMTDAVQRAVQCAVDMQHAMPGLNRELQAILGEDKQQVQHYSTEGARNSVGKFPFLEMGIAISKGRLVVGNIGCETRKKYGAVGTAINEAFRIEDKALAGEILVSEEVYASVKDLFEVRPKPGAVALKGFDQPVLLYSVVL